MQDNTLLQQEFDQQLKKFKIHLEYPIRIAVALSGGSDSMALLFLTIEWLARYPAATLVALTVDHQLRVNSAQEAKQVQQVCKIRNINHYIIPWKHKEKGEIINAGIPAKARRARYQLLTNWCIENQFSILFTAHHFNDQIEQILIRLSHGASIHGLLIPQKTLLNGIRIIRPLLNCPKQDCITYLDEHRYPWYEDPSNEQPIFLRNKLRPIVNKYLATIDSTSRLKVGISNLVRAEVALTAVTESFLVNKIEVSPLGYIKFKFLKEYFNVPEEVRLSILGYLVKKISFQGKFRLNSLLTLDHQLSNEQGKYTIAGCVLEWHNYKLLGYREFGRKLPANVAAKKDNVWDNRFLLKRSMAEAFVSLITLNDYVMLKKELLPLMRFDKDLNHQQQLKILLTLPALKRLEKIVAVPHIGYYKEESKYLEFEFIPKEIL